MHGHFYLKQVRGEDWRCSSWKIGIISIKKAISTCASNGKRVRFVRLRTLLEVLGGFAEL